MSQNSHNTPEDQEIDLSAISKKVGGFFDGLNTTLFLALQFIIRNIIILGILIVLGLGIGIYMDTTSKSYENRIIVTPNFGSVDYLYSKIELLNSKIKQNDTVFLKAIGLQGQDGKKIISKIEVKPIIDVYKFINNSEQNFDLLKLMAEGGDIKKIVEENTTSKNYTSHVIFFNTTKLTDNKKTVEPILNFLNDSDFYKKIQKEYMANVYVKIKANDTIIKQIDGFLNEFTKNVKSGASKSGNLVYYNENTQLNDVIETKDKLTIEQGNHRIELISLDKIIKDNSTTINIENSESLNGKLKLVLPVLFIFIFVVIYLFRAFYKKQSLKQVSKA